MRHGSECYYCGQIINYGDTIPIHWDSGVPISQFAHARCHDAYLANSELVTEDEVSNVKNRVLEQRLDLAERRLEAIMAALERELPEHFTRLDFDIFR